MLDGVRWVNRNGVTIVAAVLFVGSLVAFGYAQSAKELFSSMHGFEWTALDYAAFVMFVASLGCTLAVIKLKDDDDDS